MHNFLFITSLLASRKYHVIRPIITILSELNKLYYHVCASRDLFRLIWLFKKCKQDYLF